MQHTLAGATVVIGALISAASAADGGCPPPLFDDWRFKVGDNPFDVATGDFDADGDLDIDGDDTTDLVVANARTILVFPNLGDGTFGTAWRHAVAALPGDTAIANLDYDGSADLAVISWFPGAVTVLLNRCAVCPADLDGSGAVEFGDVVAILANWGPCPPECPEDLSGDGVVDFADILVALAAWGPC